MVVDTILGNTVINQWEIELKYNPSMIISHKLRETFELKYHPTRLSPDTTIATVSTNETEVQEVTAKEDPMDGSNTLIASLHQISKDSGGERESNAWI